MPSQSFPAMVILIGLVGGLVGLIWGLSTSGQRYPDAHLDRSYGMQTATPARRLSGSLLEGLLFVFTLLIGWIIWFAIVAPRGQTPAKSLLNTYVVREDGRHAGGWFMWGRELLVKWLLFGILNSFTFGLASSIASMWCLWDRNKQCLWDKIMSSYVVYSPMLQPGGGGYPVGAVVTAPEARLRELQQLRAEGVITAEEYEERRRRIVGQL